MTAVATSSKATPHSARDNLLFFGALALLYGAILLAKFSLWNANALQSDWTYYNNILWNTNYRDLWLFSYDRFMVQGYPTYLNEHFAPLLLPFATIYNHMPWPQAFLFAVHGASPVLAATGIRAVGIRVLGDRSLATVIALVFALNPGILWPTVAQFLDSSRTACCRPVRCWPPTDSPRVATAFISPACCSAAASRRTCRPTACCSAPV